MESFENIGFTSTNWQIITPLIFMLIDILTGYIQSVINHNTDSKIMREGILHKFLLVILICLSFVIQFAFNLTYFSKGIVIYICFMELVSILENIKRAGIDITYFKKLFKLGDEKDGKLK